MAGAGMVGGAMDEEGVALDLDPDPQGSQEGDGVFHVAGVAETADTAGAVGERGQDERAVGVILRIRDIDRAMHMSSTANDGKPHEDHSKHQPRCPRTVQVSSVRVSSVGTCWIGYARVGSCAGREEECSSTTAQGGFRSDVGPGC